LDRINHIKIVSPDPDAIDGFLREVLDIPEGWALGEPTSSLTPPTEPVVSTARDSKGRFTVDSVSEFRGATGRGALIAGSTESRQFQLLRGDRPHIWGVAIGTRHLERAHQRCVEREIPCTEPTLTSWGDAGICYFFAEVGGIIFEVMRAEPAGQE
jgi:hypothetical protein